MLNAPAIVAILFVSGYLVRRFFLRSSLAMLPGPPSPSWFTGNMRQIFSVDGWAFTRGSTKKYGAIMKMKGMFGADVVYVSDPLALYQIVVRDQHIFTETRSFITMNSMIFGDSLLSSEGDAHRKQRKMLNPVFSTAHMRGITPIVYPIVHKLRDALAHRIKAGDQEIDVLYWVSRAALELIGQAGFGYSFDDLAPTKESHNPYTQAVKQFAPTVQPLFLFRGFAPLIDRLFPRWLLGAVARSTPHAVLQATIRIVDVMHETSLRVYGQKKAAFEAGDEAVVEQLGAGKDIMSVLMKANAKASKEDRLTDKELIGQMSAFIFAGSDTTSSVLSKTLHILSKRPDVQERLRKEVSEAREACSGDIDYDTLVNLPFLDAVCRETLRLEPPVSQLAREASQDIVLTLTKTVLATDGKTQLSELVIKKGTILMVAIEAYNRNPDLWGPDAEEWKPERWLSPLPEKATAGHTPGIYSHMMTFFGGSRSCIGLKFSQLEMKIVLSLLLEAFVFAPGSQEIQWLKTGIQVPVIAKNGKAIDHIPKLPLAVSLVAAQGSPDL